MKVRAKFKVQSVTESEGGLKSATLTPVTTGSKENEEFYKWTPGGQINLSTMNPVAAEQFVPGRMFYVDFTSEQDEAEAAEKARLEKIAAGQISREDFTGEQLRAAYNA